MTFPQTTNSDSTLSMRCAMYARFSSDMQRKASLEDQDRNCREAIAKRGWSVEEDWVRHDAAKRGGTQFGRSGLQDLKAAARLQPRPFDVIVIDDTSRLGRNLGDVLKLVEMLNHHGIALYFVSQRLDSRDSNFRMMLTIYGMSDEQFIERLSKKVHSGQKGRVLLGFSTGSRVYGYRTTQVQDPSRMEESGRASVLGSLAQVIESEAIVIRRIFQLFADGMTVWPITQLLNSEGIPGARRTKVGPVVSAWNPTLVKRILHNERYIGVLVWNRTKQHVNPETGQIVTRKKSVEEVVRVAAPHLRIVSDELWRQVRDRFVVVNDELKNYRLGGIRRSKKDYLFSGLLKCALCGNSIIITGGKGAEAAYGCTSARYQRGCENRIRIRQDRFAAQMVQALQKRLLRPDILEHLIIRVQQELDTHLKQMTIGVANTSLVDLERQHQDQKNRIGRLYDAIENTPSELSDGLVERLTSAQISLRRLSQQIDAAKAPAMEAPSLDAIRSLVHRNVQNLLEVIEADATKARQVLQMFVKELILSPVHTQSGWKYEVLGDLDLFARVDQSEESVVLDRAVTQTIRHYTEFAFLFAGLEIDPRSNVYHYQAA